MENYDIIVLAGQSNAEGQGRGPVTREFVPDERIHFMTDDTNPEFVEAENGTYRLTMKWPAVNSVSVADERVENGQKIGCFALQFAESYVNQCLQPGRKVLIVNANFGGTGFARPEWGIGNCMHERMIAMTREALSCNPENRVVAVLWSQGEHDAFENADWDPDRRYRTHKDNLMSTFADFRERTGCKDAPVLACGFTDDYYASNPAACDAVLTAIREVIADIGGGFVVSSGLPTNGAEDFYHFNRESLHILGGRFFEKYKEICR